MISLNELKAAVEEGLRAVEKKQGVKEAEVFASSNRLNVFRICYSSNIPSNALEEPKSQEGFGLSVRVLFDNGKIGFGKEDSELSMEAVKSAFEKAKASSVLDKDFHGLPAQGEKPSASLKADKRILELDEEKAIDSAYACISGAFDALKAKDFRKNVNLTGEVDFLAERIAVANSNGVSEWDENSISLATLTTILELEKDVSGMWFDSATALNKLNTYEAGKTSAEKAQALIKAESVGSGTYDVVLGRLAVADLFYSRFEVALSSIDAKASPFIDKLDKVIGSEKLTIFDDGLLSGEIGSKRVTDEGLATGRTELVRNGKLVNFLANDYYAKKFSSDKRFNSRNGFRFGGGGRHHDSEPGIAATNLVVEAGDFKEDELPAEVKNGLYIGRIWYSYPVNGLASADFTSTMRGDSYIIRNGKIASALVPNTLRINDNLERCFKNIEALSKERKATLAWGQEAVVVTPEILVKGMRLERIAKGLY